MMVFLIIILLAALLVIAITTALNTVTFPRLGRGLRDESGVPGGSDSLISILIPARNEAAVIAESVAAHLAQESANFELLILDDQSSDGTAQLALAAGRGDARLRVVAGEPLPDGWTGKNWACDQLARRARGDLLVFTDADVRWRPGALRAVSHLVDKQRADVLTVWPTQRTVTWAERLVVPLMMMVVMGYLPELAVRWAPLPIFAAANGQCLVFRRSAYARMGGHRKVRGEVVEDVALARLAKRESQRLVMALGDQLVETRMYHDWDEVRRGFAKNILAGHGGQPLLLLASTLAHWALFLLPLAWLLAGWVSPVSSGWPWVPLAMISLGVGARALSAAATRQRIEDALLLPLSVVLMTVIAFQSLWWHYRYGGPQWKGRWIPSDCSGDAAGSEGIDA
jgi:chlorobactene glucosyltransferase